LNRITRYNGANLVQVVSKRDRRAQGTISVSSI